MSNLLTDEERRRLIALLTDTRMENMFGDGQEHDYVLNGFPALSGLQAMSDEQLLEELGHYEPADTGNYARMAALWRKELTE